MEWSVIFKVLGMVWLIGAIFYGTRMWLGTLRDRKQEGEEPFAAFLPTLLIPYALNLVLWPGALLSDFEDYAPKLAIKLGLRPDWSVLQPAERMIAEWTTTNGINLSATAIGLSIQEPARITVESNTDFVEVRILQIAPENKVLLPWKSMPSMSDRDYEETIEEESELNDKRPFAIRKKLDRGRYLVEFRVQDKKGEYEVFSGIPMVVW
jgi:hypothetical protein